MRRYALLACIAALAGSALSLRFLDVPWAWVCWLWLAVSILVMLGPYRVGAKWAVFHAAVALLVLGGLEYYLHLAQQQPQPRNVARDLQGRVVARAKPDPVLGWTPLPARVVRWTRALDEQVIFDVTYTIDRDGLRVTGPGSRRGQQHCVLFFGGSFTFGAGVEDEETMPYQVARQNEAEYRVYNFAYSGYGAHQMLALLQHGIVERTVGCEPRYAVYQGIKGHVLRAANKVSWSRHGPRYRRDADGEAVREGRFEDEPPEQPRGLRAQLAKSLIVRQLGNRATAADVDLYIAIVTSARQTFEQRYPGAEFHVLFWDDGHPLSNKLMRRLDEAGLRLHPISQILPQFGTNPGAYHLSEHDPHPNPLAHARIAEYVTERILRRDRR